MSTMAPQQHRTQEDGWVRTHPLTVVYGACSGVIISVLAIVEALHLIP